MSKICSRAGGAVGFSQPVVQAPTWIATRTRPRQSARPFQQRGVRCPDCTLFKTAVCLFVIWVDYKTHENSSTTRVPQRVAVARPPPVPWCLWKQAPIHGPRWPRVVARTTVFGALAQYSATTGRSMLREGECPPPLRAQFQSSCVQARSVASWILAWANLRVLEYTNTCPPWWERGQLSFGRNVLGFLRVGQSL